MLDRADHENKQCCFVSWVWRKVNPWDQIREFGGTAYQVRLILKFYYNMSYLMLKIINYLFTFRLGWIAPFWLSQTKICNFNKKPYISRITADNAFSFQISESKQCGLVIAGVNLSAVQDADAEHSKRKL